MTTPTLISLTAHRAAALYLSALLTCLAWWEPGTLLGANTTQQIRELRLSSRSSAGAIRHAMRTVQPGRTAREIQLRGVEGCILNGAQGSAMWGDVRSSSGNPDNNLDRTLQQGELISLKVGCEHGGFRTELSRTVPAGRSFSDQERKTWNLLAKGFQAARARLRDGSSASDLKSAFADALEGTEGARLDVRGTDAREPARVAADTVVVMQGRVRSPQTALDFQLGEILLVTPGGNELLSAGLPTSAEEIDAFMITPGYSPYIMGDIHNHLDPLPRHGLDNLIRLMNIHGIAKAVIFRGREKNSNFVLDAVSRYPDRLIASYRPNVYEIPEAWMANDPAVLAEMKQALTSGKFRGIGEVNNVNVPGTWMGPKAGRGKRLLATEVSPTSPMMISMFRLAREYNLFVNLHNEVYYYQELMEVLDQFPDVTVFWSHGGGVDYYGLDIALKNHPNLYIDLAGRVYFERDASLEDSIFHDSQSIKTVWLEVIEQHPDRFLVGFDDNSITYQERPQMVEWMAKLLDQLTPSTARKVAIENMERLLSGD